jgi:hypothetical protein
MSIQQQPNTDAVTPVNDGDGWTTVSSSKKNVGGRRSAKERAVQHKTHLKGASVSASSSSSAAPLKRPAPVQKKEVIPDTIDRVPETDPMARVVSLFNRFLNTPTDTVVASYQIDGRCINLYGLQQSQDAADQIEVKIFNNACIKITAFCKTKVLNFGATFGKSYIINFHDYDPKSGEVLFYDCSDWYCNVVRFRSNLRHLLETYETILYNAQWVYNDLVGQHLHPRKDSGSDPTPSSSSAIAPSPLERLPSPLWSRATPEDLLGRLQWYMDRFAAPGNRQVVADLIEGRLCCWSADDCNTKGRKLLPSHLTKNDATGIYTIVQPCVKKDTYVYGSGKVVENAAFEYHYNFRNLAADGSYEYWCDEYVNGTINGLCGDDKYRSNHPEHGNIHHLLSNPTAIIRMIEVGYYY